MKRILSPRGMAWILVAIVLFALLPIISVMASSGIAALGDCQLNEARAHPCEIIGVDVGGLLAFMFVAGWLALMTVPIGAVALLVWLAVAIVLALRARRMG
ncbi:hypothetical protein [Tardiphaga sp.]|jgi:hypothetical protein|uniref:hypothetical protein n=1 Tax=Tardiphaga sp. TaxID=1926292 RepID=UPI0037DA01DD